ncbi:hypothetical protein NP233_g10375 [Leucocoprinus birnbaumii]|uniref:DUF6533 domain-containing protein n=1 Tax=Leucocoprinus birnbaumii TaxID=56174 RepID=A0AAD5YRY1_9AGAR|nr:hypothetical protein NP233_g10375 [Leucocoprinus birnbaumii]
MDPPNIGLEVSHLLAGKYFQLAAFSMLVYDHILTFSQEIVAFKVDKIWLNRFSAVTALFLVNRYATLIQFIIIVTGPILDWGIVSLFFQSIISPTMLPPAHDVPKVSTLCAFRGDDHSRTCSCNTALSVGQLLMILRVYAIYDCNTRIFAFLMVLWVAQMIASVYGLHTGFPAPLSKGLVGCILNGEGPIFPSVWIAPLVTDSAIFLLTINKTKHYLCHFLSLFMSEATVRPLVILVRDGTIYFLVIFVANLLNTLIFFVSDRAQCLCQATTDSAMQSVLDSLSSTEFFRSPCESPSDHPNRFLNWSVALTQEVIYPIIPLATHVPQDPPSVLDTSLN